MKALHSCWRLFHFETQAPQGWPVKMWRRSTVCQCSGFVAKHWTGKLMEDQHRVECISNSRRWQCGNWIHTELHIALRSWLPSLETTRCVASLLGILSKEVFLHCWIFTSDVKEIRVTIWMKRKDCAHCRQKGCRRWAQLFSCLQLRSCAHSVVVVHIFLITHLTGTFWKPIQLVPLLRTLSTMLSCFPASSFVAAHTVWSLSIFFW